MNSGRLKAIARKEFIHVFRDRRSLGMAIIMPVILLFIFGYALTTDVDQVPLALWDQSQTAVSREFISHFTGSRYFRVAVEAANYAEVERAIDDGTALAGLVIPGKFADAFAARRTATAEMILDGSDSNTATIALGYAEGINRGFTESVLIRTFAQSRGTKLRPPLGIQMRTWFNEDMRSQNYIVPGLIAVILMVIAALLTSLTVAREWERGTMEQLISTPLKAGELIAGKLIPYFVIGMVDVLLAVVIGELLFEVPLRGSLLLLFLMAAVFLIGALGLGLLISIVSSNQLMANQLAMLTTFIPAFLLSGFVFPIYNMPAPVRAVTLLVPARYFVALLRALYLKGVGAAVLWPEMAMVSAFAALMVLVAKRRFIKKLR